MGVVDDLPAECRVPAPCPSQSGKSCRLLSWLLGNRLGPAPGLSWKGPGCVSPASPGWRGRGRHLLSTGAADRSAPTALWARTSGSALGGRTGPAALSRRSTEARAPNTSCPPTPVLAAPQACAGGGGEEGASEVCAGVGCCTPGWRAGCLFWGGGGLCPGRAPRPRDDDRTPHRLHPA